MFTLIASLLQAVLLFLVVLPSTTAFSVPPTSTTAPKAPVDTEKSDCKIHVGNLDWTASSDRTVDMLLTAVGDDDPPTSEVQVTIKKLPLKRKQRDQDKYHAGSAIVAFSSPDAAARGMQALQVFNSNIHNEQKKLRLRWAPTFDSFSKRQIPEKVPEVLSPEMLERRKQRAESYARRRARVAKKTDEVISKALTVDPNGQNGDFGNHVLSAPELNWSDCPSEVDPVRGGGLHKGTARGDRKQAAVEAFLFVLKAALLDEKGTTFIKHEKRRKVADLGCGAGNLSIPLAWWLQKEGYDVLGVDYNGIALDRLSQRANKLGVCVDTLQQDLKELTTLPNQAKNDDVGPVEHLIDCEAVVSLHACGIASDLAMAAAMAHSLPFAISPCCVGKVKKAWRPGAMPSLERSSREGLSSPASDLLLSMPSSMDEQLDLSYPRSIWLKEQLCDPDDYPLLASAADYGVVYNVSKSTENDMAISEELARRRRCRMAKQLVETDRLQWACERGYQVRLVELPRIGPLYPKRELLLGARRGSPAAARIMGLPTSTGLS